MVIRICTNVDRYLLSKRVPAQPHGNQVCAAMNKNVVSQCSSVIVPAKKLESSNGKRLVGLGALSAALLAAVVVQLIASNMPASRVALEAVLES